MYSGWAEAVLRKLELSLIINKLEEELNMKEETIIVEEGMNAGKVCWSRLYTCDEDKIEAISKRTFRKKSQIIRMLIHKALEMNIIEEFKI